MAGADVRGAIEREGLLLVADEVLPSVVGLVTGEAVRGSWWGHPRGAEIFHTLEALADDPDLARFKLLDGKVCLVHRRRWPAIACIGRAREPWQIDGLGSAAAALLEQLDGAGRLRASGAPAKELERRLLAASEQEHTEAGRHATVLTTWTELARVRGIPLRRRATAPARAELEAIRDRWAAAHGRRAALPWERRR